MQVVKREGYAIKSENEINLRAEASSQQQTSEAQTTQEVVKNPNETKAASEFANAKKFNDQLQANLMKDHLSGLEKSATKFAGEHVGVIKDNLGKDIKRHDGPGVTDMFNMGRKQGLGDGDPLADEPSIKRGKHMLDAPYRKNDPKLVSQGSGGELDERQKTTATEQLHRLMADNGPHRSIAKEWVDRLKEKGVYAADAFAKKKANENENKYVDPDQVSTTQIEKPKDPPPNAHDRLGHKVDGGNNLVPEYDAKTVVQAHKDRNKPLIHLDPDSQMEILFDPANPPRQEGEELKNTGNPINNNSLRPAPWPKQGGVKPHTDGDSNNS
jgi:hypothetical protein